MERDDLIRIEEALRAAEGILRPYASGPGGLVVDRKHNDDPVTEADRAVDDALRALLPRDGDGWLSEETADDARRIACRRVWVVDPLDGTKEFVTGLPEWCASVGLVEDGVAVAGGICSPATGQLIVGSLTSGVTLNGTSVRASSCTTLDGARVLASRSEVGRGEWARFEDAPFRSEAMGSVAFKLGLVAAGLADATWTLVPKHEWDVAAGVALVRAAGGAVWGLDGEVPSFNRPRPLLDGLIATAPGLAEPVRALLAGS